MQQKPRLTFLLIDDQMTQMDGLLNAGRSKQILIHAVDNVLEGIARIKADPMKYQAVILDAKCKLSKEDKAETYNEAALRKALVELDGLEKATSMHLPRCIYTGYSDAAENNEVTEKVFIKGRVGVEDDLLDYLDGEVNMVPTRIVERDFAESLALCNDHYLPRDKRNLMLTLLLKMDSTGSAEIEQFMQGIRKFLEDMYIRMHSVDGQWLPAALLPNRRPSMTWCSIYISGREVKDSRDKSSAPIVICQGLAGVPSFISNGVQFLTQATHSASHTGTYQPSRFALRGLVFTLLEVLNWFKSEVDKRTP
jgi:hypothetical protein